MRVGAIPETLLERLALLSGTAPTPIVDTFHAVIVARAIVTATKLGLFDALAPGPATADALAARLALDAPATGRLAALLVASGYLDHGPDGFALTPPSRRWLAPDSPHSLRDSMLFRLLEWQAIDRTEDYVRTGKAIDAHALIAGEQWEAYQRGMRALARLSAPEVARRLKLPATATAMLDIGGGHGAYSAAFCRARPALRATVLDLPEAVAAAAPLLAGEGLGDRIVHRAGDARDAELGRGAWDLILVAHLVHHFDAATNAGLVARAARALKPGGRLAILDALRPEAPEKGGQAGAILDLYFALTSASGTWSEAEMAGWCRNAGLVTARPLHLRATPGVSVFVAVQPAG